MDVIKLLEERARKAPHKPAFIFKDQQITFSRLREFSFRLADSLKELGIQKGDKVAIYLPNWPEYIYSYLALWCLGATAVPLDFMLSEEELVSCLTHSEAVLLIAKPKASLSLEKLKEKSPFLRNIVVCHEEKQGFLSFAELMEEGEAQAPEVNIEDKDYAIIFYTSGTTRAPKGVLINYRQLSAPPKSMEFFVNSDMTSEDTTVCALPFSHLGGLIYIQNLISFGYTLLLMERFIPLEFLRIIQCYRVNFFWLVPSMYYALLQLKEFESFDLSSLRWIVTFGASNSPDALRRFHQYCPQAHLLNGWGLTETNAPTTVLAMGSDNIESVGRPAPWIEVKIVDERDNGLPVGEMGEIVVRGWVVSDGYFKEPELTAQSMRNGWFHTGDLGRFDAEGNLYIVGRIKEMLKVGGEIVFEPQIEAVIQKCPDVTEVAVIGVPDSLRGEVPKAYVVLKYGSLLDEQGLRDFCRRHLAHFKMPHYFEFVESLPKNRSGKIDKEVLRKNSYLESP